VTVKLEHISVRLLGLGPSSKYLINGSKKVNLARYQLKATGEKGVGVRGIIWGKRG